MTDRQPSLGGRPLTMSPEERGQQVMAVLARMEQGESENKACIQVGINRHTFRCAAMRHGVAEEYARAMEALAQDQTEKLEETIADMRNGTVDAAMARVEIDARKWFASKFLPKRYGDRQQVDMKAEVVVSNTDPAAILNQLVATASEFPVTAQPLRELLTDALKRLPT